MSTDSGSGSRVGILIIGSLFWRDEPVRANWRQSRLHPTQAIRVKVPIRYLRRSKNLTYTMTFAPEAHVGTALVVPCQAAVLDAARLETEAEALWAAEKNTTIVRNAVSESWGCVGALFRNPEQSCDLIAAWSRYFKTSQTTPIAPVNADGLLQLRWPARVDGQALDFDVLLATANQPTGSPTAENMADAWIHQADSEEYFFRNVQNGIRTSDDAKIWLRLSDNAAWLERVGAKFPEAIATLRSNYPVYAQALPRVRTFAPELWGAVDRFARLYSETYQLPKHVHDCIGGTSAHFRRATLLRDIAADMIPSLQADIAELTAKGHTDNEQTRRLTAVIESAITSLYSSVDAARKVITHIFAKHQGLPDSTRRTFQNAADGKLDPKLPQWIRDAFQKAAWYPRFRRLRDALTHIGPGSCHLDRESGKVMYFHDAIREGDKVTHIPDIFAEFDAYLNEVNLFHGQLFTALVETLKDDEVWQMCGIFDGRLYSRFVRPSEAKNMQSGRCDAYKWFELPENPRCPLAEKCEAYARRFSFR